MVTIRKDRQHHLESDIGDTERVISVYRGREGRSIKRDIVEGKGSAEERAYDLSEKYRVNPAAAYAVTLMVENSGLENYFSQPGLRKEGQITLM